MFIHWYSFHHPLAPALSPPSAISNSYPSAENAESAIVSKCRRHAAHSFAHMIFSGLTPLTPELSLGSGSIRTAVRAIQLSFLDSKLIPSRIRLASYIHWIRFWIKCARSCWGHYWIRELFLFITRSKWLLFRCTMIITDMRLHSKTFTLVAPPTATAWFV